MSIHPLIPLREPATSATSKTTVAGYCARMLMLWIAQCERMIGFDSRSR